MSSQFESCTIPALINHSMSAYKGNLLFSNIGNVEITYGQAEEKIQTIQSIFKALDIKKGDKVVICSENMPHWGVIYLAITGMGAVVVPILTDFHMNEIHHIIKHSEASAIFASKRLMNKLEEDDFSSSLKYMFSLETLELLAERMPKKSEFLALTEEKIADIKEKAQKIKNEIAENNSSIEVVEDDIASIIYTSGTTGQSKGVMLSHKNIVRQSQQLSNVIKVYEEDRFLSILPMAHTYECSAGFLLPFSKGASVHYINKMPSPKVILSAVKVVRPTCMLSVPLVIEKIYKSKIQAQFNKNKVVKFLYEKVPFARKKLNRIAGKKLHESFGGKLRVFAITETSPVIAAAIPGKTKVGTTGVFLDNVEYKLKQLTEGSRDGELHVRGPNVMMGYYKDIERTEEILDADGWINTGDLGYVDDNGVLAINGRSKNVIIGASGENIYPEAVESVINRHQLVLDSLVYESAYKVVAKIHIDYDQFDVLYNLNNTSDSKIHDRVLALLEEIRVEVNTQVSNFSKLSRVIEQPEPFVKTPTKKIKRYLYTAN